jgi:hypothetical protein
MNGARQEAHGILFAHHLVNGSFYPDCERNESMRVTAEWIDGHLLIPELLRAAPQTRPVLDRYGLKGCGGAQGPAESLAFFAQAHEVALPRLLDELREAIRPGPQPIALPLAEAPSRADTIYRPFFTAGMAVTLTLGAVWRGCTKSTHTATLRFLAG